MAAQAQLRFKSAVCFGALLSLLACQGLIFGVNQLQPVLWNVAPGVIPPGQVAMLLPILVHPDHVWQLIQHSTLTDSSVASHAGVLAGLRRLCVVLGSAGNTCLILSSRVRCWNASSAQQPSEVSMTMRACIVSQEANRLAKKKAKHCEQCLALSFGSPTWARTRDLRINSPSLYRLSYQGTFRCCLGF